LCTFQAHVTACPFFNSLQSAYTAQVTQLKHLFFSITLNSIYTSADSGHATLLVSLDLSAAFDTIDHDLLISRLQHSFGISGSVLSWLKSYLHNRSQSVRVGSVSSNSFTLTTGVPQGYVLGPVLFSVYITPISSLIATHNLQHQQYADDTQLYIAVSPADYAPSVIRLESCLTDSLPLAFSQWPPSESYKIG